MYSSDANRLVIRYWPIHTLSYWSNWVWYIYFSKDIVLEGFHLERDGVKVKVYNGGIGEES